MDTPNIHSDTKINGIPENQAFDLITELEKALLEAEGNQQLVFLKNQQLVDNLIANETLPEVYAQRLLRLKVFFKIKQGQYDNALLDLSVLDNTENRLVCATYEFYKLLFVKYDILIAKGQHLEAYNFLKAIKINFFEEEAFLKLKEHQALFREWTIKSAIAAHFIADNESYNLFRSLLFDPTSVFHLDARNKDILLFYGYECFRQKKYPEAITAFATLSEINSNASFLQETKAMMNFSKIANNEIDSEVVAWLQSPEAGGNPQFERLKEQINKELIQKNNYTPTFLQIKSPAPLVGFAPSSHDEGLKKNSFTNT